MLKIDENTAPEVPHGSSYNRRLLGFSRQPLCINSLGGKTVSDAVKSSAAPNRFKQQRNGYSVAGNCSQSSRFQKGHPRTIKVAWQRRIAIKLYAVLPLAIFSLGCAASLYPLPPEPVENAVTLIDKVHLRSSSFENITAEARISGKSKRGRAMGKVSILANYETSQLRVDAWTPTDDLVLSLVADSDEFYYLERGDKYCITGQSCPSNMRLLLPLGLDLTSIIGALFGIPPDIDSEGDWAISFDRTNGAYRLDLPVAQETLVSLWVMESGLVIKARKVNNGRLDYEIKFKGYSKDSIPGVLEFKSETDSTTATIRIREYELNAQIEMEDWSPPCSTNLRWLPCQEE